MQEVNGCQQQDFAGSFPASQLTVRPLAVETSLRTCTIPLTHLMQNILMEWKRNKVAVYAKLRSVYKEK